MIQIHFTCQWHDTSATFQFAETGTVGNASECGEVRVEMNCQPCFQTQVPICYNEAVFRDLVKNFTLFFAELNQLPRDSNWSPASPDRPQMKTPNSGLEFECPFRSEDGVGLDVHLQPFTDDPPWSLSQHLMVSWASVAIAFETLLELSKRLGVQA